MGAHASETLLNKEKLFSTFIAKNILCVYKMYEQIVYKSVIPMFQRMTTYVIIIVCLCLYVL